MGKGDGTQPLRPPTATIAGVKVVTIPLADYAALLDSRRRLAESEVRSRPYFSSPTRSPIDRDPVLAVFLAERLVRMDAMEAWRQCHDHFGGARAPSKSAVYRYRDRIRAAAPR